MFFLFFIFGLVLGSFANVLIYRIPLGLSIIFPNSFCPNCKAPIKWYDNIPILSYIFLSGRCRSCKAKISIIYPVVEFLCGSICVLLYFKFGLSFSFFIFLNLFFVLLVISFIDIKTTEVPDVLSYYLIISGFVLSFLNPILGFEIPLRIMNSFIGGLIGFCFLVLIEILGRKIFKKPAIGGGDVKIFCALGTYLGVNSIFRIMFFACVIALAYVLILGLIKKEKIFGKYLQFVPFISIGCLIYVFLFVNL
jgi:leader peptidase (prepilin peptidase)/N-methyltransferase